MMKSWHSQIHRLGELGAAIFLIAMPLEGIASCMFVAQPTTVTTPVYVVGYAGGGQKLKTGILSTEFSFKCDTDTAYSLSFKAGGVSNGGFELQNGGGFRVPVNPMLKSLDGKKLDVFFKDLPEAGYQGHAVTGKIYHMVVDLVPTSTQLPAGRLSGALTGNMQLSIDY